MKKSILSVALMAMSMGAMADATQTVTISGTSVDKQVASLSFDGDNVVITFSEGDTQTVDMEELSILLTYSENSGIVQIESDDNQADGKIFNLAGQYVGDNKQSLNRGIYIVNGKKIVVK